MENDIICTPQCHTENLKPTNIGHLENDGSYEHGYIHSMENPSNIYGK